MIMRFLVLFCISFLLLSPVIKYLQLYFDNPIIIVAQDKSESIGLVNNMGANTPVEYIKQFDNFSKKLSKEYEIKLFTFGEKLSDTLTYEYDEKETDISELFKEINSRFVNYNIGALVLATDGIYNKGLSPVYAARDFAFPVYTIALGDTARKRDLILKNAFSNRIAFLNDYFPVEVLFSSFGYKNQSATVKILNKGNVVTKELVNITDEDFSKQLKFEVWSLSIMFRISK